MSDPAASSRHAATPEPAHQPARETVAVRLGARSYDIVVGSGLLEDAGRYVAPLLKRPRTLVVTDANVAAHHLERLRRGLAAAGIACSEITLPPGEATKDFAHLETLLDGLLGAGIERRDIVVALGGGVVGDLVGFAASVLRRGIDFIQVPTTLLAQVDSSVGGKTGINTRHGKNLVGSFHQPVLVLADDTALDTLALRELRAGYAEVVKYGLLGDPEFFLWLEAHGAAVLGGAGPERRFAIARSCRAKARIVALDERETSGERALLNLGHTFAHAFEAEAGYGAQVLHGEAVAVGLRLAFDLSVRLGHCPAEDRDRALAHLRATGLATDVAALGLAETPAERFLLHMRQDKKVSDGRLVFVLAAGIGRAFLSREVPAEAVAACLDAARSR